MINDIADLLWDCSSNKRLHECRMSRLGEQSSALYQQIFTLQNQVEEARQQLKDRELQRERLRAYQADCEKLEYLIRRDPAAARELLRVMYSRHPQFVRSDSSFEQRVRALLDAETRAFREKLYQIVI